jgi:hypothetical protein
MGMEQETRVVDPNSGGEKGAKLARFSLIPADFLWALAEHYGRGARKYEDRNWEKGYKWSLSVDALHRHLAQWLVGEDNDEETGSSHLIAVAWHAIALWWWHKRGLGTNDVRPQTMIIKTYPGTEGLKQGGYKVAPAPTNDEIEEIKRALRKASEMEREKKAQQEKQRLEPNKPGYLGCGCSLCTSQRRLNQRIESSFGDTQGKERW